MEDNGKHIIIGVYPNDIRFESFPNTINLSLWWQFRVNVNWGRRIEFRVRDDKKEQLFFATAMIGLNPPNEGELLTITIPDIMLGITGPTILSFQIREVKKRWQILKKMPVLPR